MLWLKNKRNYDKKYKLIETEICGQINYLQTVVMTLKSFLRNLWALSLVTIDDDGPKQHTLLAIWLSRDTSG